MATSTKLMSHTPPSAASDSSQPVCQALAPSRFQGPPRGSQERATS
jgi:hypothetical protein